jgi:hypothetical protein
VVSGAHLDAGLAVLSELVPLALAFDPQALLACGNPPAAVAPAPSAGPGGVTAPVAFARCVSV